MKRSKQRILTTHVGRMYRTEPMLAQYRKLQAGEPVDQHAFNAQVRADVTESVRYQAAQGVDVVSDGEIGRLGFFGYLNDRMAGVERRKLNPARPLPFWGMNRDRKEFPAFYAIMPTKNAGAEDIGAATTHPVVTGPLKYKPEQAKRDIANFKEALSKASVEEGFLPVAVPNWYIVDEHYSSRDALLHDMADAAHEEYKLLTDAGIIIQLDDPFILHMWDQPIPPIPLAEYRKEAEKRIELLNYATRGIRPEMIRYHLCWGSWHGPHVHDLPLKDIVDVTLKIHAEGFSMEAANPRHAHEWKVWKDAKLPADKALIPGVVAHHTNVVEHPEVVADTIIDYATVAGRENVLASTDCGFGGRVHQELGWAKLKTLSEGAKLATSQLWRK